MPQIRYAKNVNPGVHALAEYAVVGAQIYQRGVSWACTYVLIVPRRTKSPLVKWFSWVLGTTIEVFQSEPQL